ncbi:hypothetical protein V8B97DRAFT_2086753 [Scleroderma yunnanense]
MSCEADTPLALSPPSSPTSGSIGTSVSSKDPCSAVPSLEKCPLAEESLQTPRVPTNKHRAESTSPPRPISDHQARQILEYISSKFWLSPCLHNINASGRSVHEATSSPMPTNIDLIEVDSLNFKRYLLTNKWFSVRAVLVKEASHEYQRQSLLATAWRIEELKRYIEFMEGVQEEIKNSFGDPSEKLTLLESILSQCSLSELRDERSKLLNTYDVDVSKLVAIDSQLGRPGGTASRLKPRRRRGDWCKL